MMLQRMNLLTNSQTTELLKSWLVELCDKWNKCLRMFRNKKGHNVMSSCFALRLSAVVLQIFFSYCFFVLSTNYELQFANRKMLDLLSLVVWIWFCTSSKNSSIFAPEIENKGPSSIG
jgi:hypothetical protein